jgi:hypothetical protein
MFIKQLMAMTVALLLSTAALPDVSISGKYTGTVDSDGDYTQDIETTLKGLANDSSVTVTFDKDFAVDDMFVESTVGVAGFELKLKAGEVDDETSIGATTSVAGFNLGVTQVSGGTTRFDVGSSTAGITWKVADLNHSTRETTASYSLAGIKAGIVHAKSGDDHQIQNYASYHLGGSLDEAGASVGGYTLSIDHNQNVDRDAFEDGSWGGSVSTAVGSLGTVKAEGQIKEDDTKTYGLSLTKGIFTGAWDKTGDADGVLSLKAVVTF